MRLLIPWVIFILALGIVHAAVVDPSVEQTLAQQGQASVIIELHPAVSSARGLLSLSADEKTKTRIVQESFLQRFSGQNGLKIQQRDFTLQHQYAYTPAVSGDISRAGLALLRDDPLVKSIRLVKNYSITLDVSVPLINATPTWKLVYNGTNITGRGVTVCVLDTGINYTHTSLGSCTSASFLNGSCPRIPSGYDEVNGDADPIDDNGHGTHVSGIIISNDSTYRGVAPDANVVMLKVCNSGGSCNDANILAGLNWCINNRTQFNISVISMSLGDNGVYNASNCSDSTLYAAITTARNNGIIVTVASGNCQGIACNEGVSSPACTQNATRIGAVNDADVIQFQRGSLFQLLAPGIGIISTYFGGFASASGTSMATPHAAGVAALLVQYRKLENNTNLTPTQIEDALNRTGKIVSDGSGTGFSFRRVNVFDALLYLDRTAPVLTLVTPSNNTKTSSNSSFVNVTSSEVLSTAILEWNGTNQTLSGSTLNWFVNKTFTKGNFSFRIWGNDSANNMQVIGPFNLIGPEPPNVTGFAPASGNNSILETANLTFNISFTDPDNDSVTLQWFVNSTLAASSGNYTFLSNFTSNGTYNITVVLTDGNFNVSQEWNLTVNDSNRAPLLRSNISTIAWAEDTNTTLNLTLYFNDSDPDNTLGYNSTAVENISLLFNNQTGIVTFSPEANLTGLRSVFFYAFDGQNTTGSNNVTLNVTPVNDVPYFTLLRNITVNETRVVNLTINATDVENDTLTFAANDSRFLQSNTTFVWQTNLSDAGTYSIRVNVSDGTNNTNATLTVIVLDERDFDNDGNPDYLNDTDDDNDGLADGSDVLLGNLSTITSTIGLQVRVNGTMVNTTYPYTDAVPVNITDANNNSLVSFSWNFSLATLQLNWTIDYSSTNGSLIVSNVILPSGSTKTVFINKSSGKNTLCITDADVVALSSSSSCLSNETSVSCTGSSGSYICSDGGDVWKVSGLNHSGVRQITVSSGSSDSTGGTGSSGGGSSSGGGGGGGGSVVVAKPLPLPVPEPVIQPPQEVVPNLQPAPKTPEPVLPEAISTNVSEQPLPSSDGKTQPFIIWGISLFTAIGTFFTTFWIRRNVHVPKEK